MGEKILEVNHLKTYFHTDAGLSKAVNDVSFFVEKGKTLGIVGESGCGKSITSLSIMGLVETPPGEIAGGEIIFEGFVKEKRKRDEQDPGEKDRYDLPGTYDIAKPCIYYRTAAYRNSDAS